LSGRTVVITRDATQSAALEAELAARGAEAVRCPVIAIGPPETWAEVDAALAGWAGIEWVVFTSANAATHLLARMAERGLGGDAWHGKRVAAVGAATAALLAAHGVAVDVVPAEHTGRELARALLDAYPPPAGEVLVPRSSKAREELAEWLAGGGWPVRTVAAYRNVPARPDRMVLARAAEADAVTFASPSAVRGFAAAAGADFFRRHPRVVAAAIGPTTAAALAELAPAALVVAEPFTAAGLVQSLERFFASNRV
jgi:uroporphyrinogen III methyltransferase/synthase